MAEFTPRLSGCRVAIFVDFTFEDLEVMYPKIRLEEEGATVLIVGSHAAGMKFTGKHGYPIKSDLCVDDLDVSTIDGLILPGGFAPDYMRRSAPMLKAIVDCVAARKPCAAICHGPWMFCSARAGGGAPVVSGRRCTAFVSIKDDLVNAGGIWVDAPVVVDGPLITSRTPADLTPFCHAFISAILAAKSQ
ncbi:protease/amidase [Pelagophyceae sp. CCMP2097]|nr:protease/amidase [Pelagophyceae sp. CCMP2097]